MLHLVLDSAQDKTPPEVEIFKDSVVLAKSASCALLFAVSETKINRRVYFPSDRLILASYAQTPITLRTYSPPMACQFPRFNRNEKLTLQTPLTLQPREAYFFDNPAEIVDFNGDLNACYLVLADIRPCVWPLKWAFDPSTLIAQNATFGDRRLSYVRAMIDLLGRFAQVTEETEDCISVLDKLSFHDHHIIRWAAIQAMGRIDFQSTIPALRRAENDSHPDLRTAAQKYLVSI